MSLQAARQCAIGLVAALLCGAGCGADAPGRIPGAPTPLVATSVHVAGLVTDESGMPVADALVGALYWDEGFLWETTHSDTAGRYDLYLSVPHWYGTDVVGRASAAAGEREYDDHVQWVSPPLVTSIVRNFRLRRARFMVAGDTVPMRLDGTSNLCLDAPTGEPPLELCAAVWVTAPTDGVLHAEVSPVAGGAMPTIEIDGVPPGPGGMPVVADRPYRVRVSLPISNAPVDLVLTTSLR